MEIKKMRHSQSSSTASETFDLSKIPDEETTECVSLTLWVPVEIKQKYDQIQRKSKKRFGKFLKKLIIKNVESVKVEA